MDSFFFFEDRRGFSFGAGNGQMVLGLKLGCGFETGKVNGRVRKWIATPSRAPKHFSGASSPGHCGKSQGSEHGDE
jgi:hypothetical protein